MDSNKRHAICSSGKSYLINPNLLFGQDASDNLFVPPEDLNIYVELTTSKKSRSVIDLTDDEFIGTSTEKSKAKVSFIDGSNISGKEDEDGNPKKSLTTSYTELTTVFNKTADTEKFGITSINIDFNSAYAPLVKIEFVDVRGASLFNTHGENGPVSEYSGFFDLPYPIFNLKVKGYYGKTVKYCLHLTRWNARFNSQTGNFEISADFIGYTYAMLSDMLLGYLRAITKTEAGKTKFNNVKNQMARPEELITINELLNKIVDVNESITKLQDKDKDILQLSSNQEIQKALDGIENLLESGIESISKPDDSSLEGYSIIKTGDGLIGVRNNPQDLQETINNKADLDNWKSAMKLQVDKLNDNLAESSKYQVEDFTDVKFYENFVYNEIFEDVQPYNTKQINFRSAWDLNESDEKFKEFEERILGLNSRNKGTNMNLYDFKKTYEKIRIIRDSLKTDEETIKKNVGQKLRSVFSDTIGFEPSIRNIFRIFTVHAEIFMECLKDVSEKAELDISKLRYGELKKLKDQFDIHKKDVKKGTLPPKIWPWPLFRTPSDSDSKSKTLEEAYLGGDDGVDIPQNVPELVFVEELLEGLLAVGREDIDREERINNPDTIIGSWFPINVLDTPLFGVTENPYKTRTIGNSNNTLDPLKLMMLRAFTFLGVSNRTPLVIESETMGTLEANTCYEGLSNDVVKKALIGDSSLGDSEIADKIIGWFQNGKNDTRNLTAKAASGEEARGFLYEDGKYYKYKFFSNDQSGDGGKGLKFIPINGNFDGSEFYKDGKPQTNNEAIESKKLSYQDTGIGGNLFISTYANTSAYDGF